MSLIDYINKAKLTEVSKRNYITKLNQMMETFDVDLETIVKNPKVYGAKIMRVWKEPRTQRMYINAIIALFKHAKKLRDTNSNDYEDWTALRSPLDDKVKEMIYSNQGSESQQKGFVDFPTFAGMREKLPEGSVERLLVAMYSLIPPVRADFGDVSIFYREPIGEKKNKGNYIVLGAKPMLVLNEYKTYGKLGAMREKIPDKLAEEIENSLERHPRDFLFVNKNGEAYSGEQFSKWANTVFKRLFKKPLTITLVRRSFISNMDMNTTSIAQKLETATAMGHGLSQQDEYRMLRDK